MEQRIPGYCALCISRCGCISVVENGILKSVEPFPDHPTGQSLCVKGKAAPELVYSPQRILSPLKRTKAKGSVDPGWKTISWEEALETIAGRLKEIAKESGPEAVTFGVTTPSGTGIADSFVWANRLARVFGSPNTLFATENCNTTASTRFGMMLATRRAYRKRFTPRRLSMIVSGQLEPSDADEFRFTALAVVCSDPCQLDQSPATTAAKRRNLVGQGPDK